MDKMAIARRKCARGAVLTLLFGNPRAAVMQRTLEYALHAGRSAGGERDRLAHLLSGG